MSKEAMKLALEALEGLEALLLSMGLTHLIVYGDTEKAITNLQKELEDQPAQQEPVAWIPIDQPYPPGGELDILMGDGSILCEVLPQADGDLWWGGASTGERFIDPKYASVTHWRIHAEHTSPPAQRTWVGLTDEEVLDMARTFGAQPWPPNSCAALGKMIEAKLKEKNT